MISIRRCTKLNKSFSAKLSASAVLNANQFIRGHLSSTFSTSTIHNANDAGPKKSSIRLFQTDWIEEYLNYHRFGQSDSRRCLLDSSINEISAVESQSSAGAVSSIESGLNSSAGAVSAALQMRVDVSDLLRQAKKSSRSPPSSNTSTASPSATSPAVVLLEQLDGSLRRWLGTYFCADAIDLVALDFRTCSGAALSFIAEHESVVPVANLDELRRRMSGTRRCFALVHPRLPNAPLAYIYAACTSAIAGSMDDLDSLATPFYAKDSIDSARSEYEYYNNNTAVTTESPFEGVRGNSNSTSSSKAVMFYSVNSPHPGLSGLDVASSLIKAVAKHLSKHHNIEGNGSSSIHSTATSTSGSTSKYIFSTLSPVPGFMAQLRGWANIGTKNASLNITSSNSTSSTAISSSRGHMPVLSEAHCQSIQAALRQILNWSKHSLNLSNRDSIISSYIGDGSSPATSTSTSANSIRVLFCILGAFAHNEAELSIRAFASIKERDNNASYVRIDSPRSDSGESSGGNNNKKNSTGDDVECVKAIFEVLRAQEDASVLRSLFNSLKEPTMQLCFEYITKCKAPGNQPQDPVSRFHLRNGSSFHGMHWAGHMTQPSRVQQSAGILVNYLYDLKELQDRHTAFISGPNKGAFHINPDLADKYK